LKTSFALSIFEGVFGFELEGLRDGNVVFVYKREVYDNDNIKLVTK